MSSLPLLSGVCTYSGYVSWPHSTRSTCMSLLQDFWAALRHLVRFHQGNKSLNCSPVSPQGLHLLTSGGTTSLRSLLPSSVGRKGLPLGEYHYFNGRNIWISCSYIYIYIFFFFLIVNHVCIQGRINTANGMSLLYIKYSNKWASAPSSAPKASSSSPSTSELCEHCWLHWTGNHPQNPHSLSFPTYTCRTLVTFANHPHHHERASTF